MSERAQEVRKKHLKGVEELREKAKIVFDYIIDVFDENTSEGVYSPVNLLQGIELIVSIDIV